jgi:shikimate dehydrogenase
MASEWPKAAVVGWPAKHSLSPLIMKTWLDETGQPGDYAIIECEPDAFESAARARFNAGLVGVNVTVPHKEAALKLADTASDAARAIGAANVLVWREGRIEADNTDHVGIARALESDSGSGPAVLIGAGGAARAALYHLKAQDREIRILNRTRDRAEALAAEFGISAHIHTLDDPAAFKDASLVINATSLGMTGQPPLTVDLSGMEDDALVFDMVYAPLKTELLAQAGRLGRRTADGLIMLVGQARPAFERFFGAPAPEHEGVRHALLAALEQRA